MNILWIATWVVGYKRRVGETVVLDGIAILDKSNRVILSKSINIENIDALISNLLDSNVVERVKSADEGFIKTSLNSYQVYLYKVNDELLTIFQQSEKIGNLLKSNYIAQFIKNKLIKIGIRDRREISKLDKEFKCLINPKTPDINKFYSMLMSVINGLSQEELIKYALTLFTEIKSYEVKDIDQLLKPYHVVNFEDGVKRSIAAAFYGDLIESFRLALGAIKYKWDAIVALFAFYVGFKLREFPAHYIAPTKKSLDNILKRVKPKNEIERILYNFFKLLRDSMDSYKAFLESKAFIRRNVDRIFEIFEGLQNVYYKDILSFILSTIDPGVLSRRKIEVLRDYIGARSHILGAYLRVALSRLRSLSIVGARELFVRDVLGYIRWMRSNYLNSKEELIELLRKGLLDGSSRESREVLITYIGTLTEYLRSVYYALSIREMSFSKLENYIREVLSEFLEGLKIALEKPPQVPLDQLFEPIEFGSLIVYFSISYMNDSDKEEFIRGVLNLISSLYIILKRNINEDRLPSKWITRLFVLLWLSSMLSSWINDMQPYVIPLGRDVLNYVKKKRKEVLKASRDTFVLILLTMSSSISYLSMSLNESKRREMFNKLNSELESLLNWILKGRILQIPLLISLVESMIRLGISTGLTISDSEMSYLVSIAKAILNENIGDTRKMILYDLLGENKHMNFIKRD